jgi:CRISPR-associated protein Csb2
VIAIEVTFLTGRYVATAHDRRDGHEWPPHWARMFSAMVATWAEDGEDAVEATLLRDIETWGHPSIAASVVAVRQASVHWVPVNDPSVHGLALQRKRSVRLDDGFAQRDEAERHGSARKLSTAQRRIDAARDVRGQVASVGNTPPSRAAELLPEHRPRQERRFPSVTPNEARVLFVWSDRDAAPGQFERLDRLLSRVARLGHSSSFVSCRAVSEMASEGPPVRFVPERQPHATRLTLRSIGAGQLDALIASHQRHQGVRPRGMPHRAVIYRDRLIEPDGAPVAERSLLSGEMIVLARVHGPRLPIIRAVEVARSLRGALMAHSPDPLPELISGHRRAGSEAEGTEPSARAHAAYIALPFVGSRHATGHLLGAAIVLPRDVTAADRATVESALVAAKGPSAPARSERGVRRPPPLRLTLGTNGVLGLAPVLDEAPAQGLRASAWSRPAYRWASVTPVALPRHPGRLNGGSATEAKQAWQRATQAVHDSCEHVGLPRPQKITLQLAPLVAGTRDARSFPSFTQGSGSRRQARALVHAELVFDRPVAGPLLLGSGRYQGLGLMRPVDMT